ANELQFAQYFAQMVSALSAIERHHAPDDLGYARGQFGSDLGERREYARDQLLEQLAKVLALEWPFSARALVQDHADCPDIGAMVDIAFAERLLGRHVLRR